MNSQTSDDAARAMPVAWPSEWLEPAADRETGVAVRRLTRYKAHSYHLYFTNPGWHAEGRRLLFASERRNRANLYSLSLDDGSMRQLTDLDAAPGERVDFQNCCVNPTREEAYFWYRRRLIALSLDTGAQRAIVEAPDGMTVGIVNCTADGRFICTTFGEDLSDRIYMDLGNGYVGFREYFAARPRCQVVRIGVDDGAVETVVEERSWIGHINTSPTQAHLLTYCHEGPWELVDNRIWGLDLRTGRTWKLRPKSDPRERVGHEYWFRDGLHIGYHGTTVEGKHLYGALRYDGADRVEAAFPGGATHFHSNDLSLIVGDGFARDPYILLWRFRDGVFEGPRRVCRHRGSFHTQHLHVHPRLSPDGAQILFTADPDGYGNLYLAETPAFDRLPETALGV